MLKVSTWIASSFALTLAPGAFGSTALSQAELPLQESGCGCSGKADCTCKKGQCKCSKCGKHRAARMFQTFRDVPELPPLPDSARRDASAGVFI